MMRSPDNRDLPLQARCSESLSPRPPKGIPDVSHCRAIFYLLSGQLTISDVIFAITHSLLEQLFELELHLFALEAKTEK